MLNLIKYKSCVLAVMCLTAMTGCQAVAANQANKIKKHLDNLGSGQYHRLKISDYNYGSGYIDIYLAYQDDLFFVENESKSGAANFLFVAAIEFGASHTSSGIFEIYYQGSLEFQCKLTVNVSNHKCSSFNIDYITYNRLTSDMYQSTYDVIESTCQNVFFTTSTYLHSNNLPYLY